MSIVSSKKLASNRRELRANTKRRKLDDNEGHVWVTHWERRMKHEGNFWEERKTNAKEVPEKVTYNLKRYIRTTTTKKRDKMETGQQSILTMFKHMSKWARLNWCRIIQVKVWCMKRMIVMIFQCGGQRKQLNDFREAGKPSSMSGLCQKPTVWEWSVHTHIEYTGCSWAVGEWNVMKICSFF